jgi:hypothetical protein
MFTDQTEGPVDSRGDLRIRLDGYSGKSLLVASE